MDIELEKKLIKKCIFWVEATYINPCRPIRMTEIRDLLLTKGIPFNILYKAYHVKADQFLFYDRSELLTQTLTSLCTVMKWRGSEDRLETTYQHMMERISNGCYRVNKDAGHIDIYDKDYGVVLYPRDEYLVMFEKEENENE